MPYYLVNMIGTGTKEDKFRPDVDPYVSYVCQASGSGQAVVLTSDPIDPTEDRTELVTDEDIQEACNLCGISFSDVTNQWYIEGVSEFARRRQVI